MEATAKRRVHPGEEFERLFPIPEGVNITVKENAGLEDTLKLIKKTVPLTLKDTEKFVNTIPKGSLKEVCEYIWQFVYDHIAYKRDEAGVEQIRRPARSWWDRKRGVDCDCYTEFISSCLTNLGIPHKLRITKYSQDFFQHIYPVIPKDGRLDYPLKERDDYIVLDCVKEAFDDEQPYTEFKDYPMRLEFLNGIDDQNTFSGSVDTYDIGSTNDYNDLNGDDQLNGRFGKWLSKVGDTVKKGVRFLNRFTNPATILLRNGFLLCMKINFLRVASKLRFGYLTDEQAQKLGMNMDAFRKLKKIREKAENIYYGAGGKKENLKKAILKGKGNKDGKVPLDGFGFEGVDGLDGEYADEQEYNIIKYGNLRGVYDEMGDLGDPATGASIAAATAAITAIAGALSQVKNLFKKGSPEEKQFNQPATGGGDVAADTGGDPDTTSNSSTDEATSESAPPPAGVAASINRTGVQRQSRRGSIAKGANTRMAATEDKVADNASQEKGIMAWVKANPGKALLAAGLVLGGGFMLYKRSRPQGLNGFGKRKYRKKKNKPTAATRRGKVTTIKF